MNISKAHLYTSISIIMKSITHTHCREGRRLSSGKGHLRKPCLSLAESPCALEGIENDKTLLGCSVGMPEVSTAVALRKSLSLCLSVSVCLSPPTPCLTRLISNSEITHFRSVEIKTTSYMARMFLKTKTHRISRFDLV